MDLFKPHDFNYRYKVIVINKTTHAKHVVQYHEGRGSQEGLFAELKTEAAMSYVPCNSWNANKLFL
ncbi:MAG: IS1380 family transposase, partial [Granulosicoccus sp.]